jgi:predicted metal-dependent phosphoesterase TrpH
MAQLSDGATLGRPHLADALIAKGHVNSREDAFTALLHNQSKYYVAHYSPTPEDAIRLIKAAGGVAVIAHPYASHRGRVITAESFRGLVDAGLDGIEVDHRDHSETEKASLLRVAYSYDLAITGASDYHGSGKINKLAENTTELRQWEKLELRANNRRVVRK